MARALTESLAVRPQLTDIPPLLCNGTILFAVPTPESVQAQ
jgi:hypothetical protein